jgi:hypothetical protein
MDRTTPAKTAMTRDHRRLEKRDHKHLHVPEHHDKANHDHSVEPVELVRIGLMALACLASWLGLGITSPIST